MKVSDEAHPSHTRWKGRDPSVDEGKETWWTSEAEKNASMDVRGGAWGRIRRQGKPGREGTKHEEVVGLDATSTWMRWRESERIDGKMCETRLGTVRWDGIQRKDGTIHSRLRGSTSSS